MRQSRVRNLLVLVPAFACFWPAVTSAQYAVQAADTLWYTETTRTNIVMRPPTGALTLASTSDAEIGITFVSPGKARAWFAALRIQQDALDNVSRPDMSPVLHRPYHLSFGERGRIVVDSVPTFPATLAGAADLAHQFADFFISLPSEALRPGVAWVDTLRFSDGNGRAKTYRAQRIRSFRVERDTAVGQASAFLINVTEAITVNATEIDDQGNTITMQIAGTENGMALFSPELGRMLRRERTGHMSGEMKLVGAAMPVTMPQQLDYTSQIVYRR